MKNGKTILYRVYQGAMALALRVLPEKKQELVTGNGSFLKAAVILKQHGVHKVQIVTTAGTVRRGTLAPLLSELESEGIEAAVFDGVRPDPDLSCIECAAKSYRDEGCDAFLSVGGGSAIDCTKLAAARTVKPEQPVEKMKGTLKVRRKLPFTVAVPTTAGTGSEVTAAAVATDAKRELKFPVADLCLVPDAAILDPLLTCALPKSITADTGMDAFTHAIEAYTNCFASQKVRHYALDAMKLIHENLLSAYMDGYNLPAREHLLLGSYYAGIAFTNGYVGYVHAIAHAVGALYHIPHGRANAVLLPAVLREYGSCIAPKLAVLADALSLGGDTVSEKAERMIAAIEAMRDSFDIPSTLPHLPPNDYAEIARRALKEANPTYPVPQIWDSEKIFSVLRRVQS